MANQWSGTIATQTAHFRGTSTVNIAKTFTEFPNFRAINGAHYAAEVIGGVSGTFAILVIGYIGGITVTIAGNTNMGSATVGKMLLYPTVYGTTMFEQQPGTAISAASRIIVDSVPPAHVAFQSSVATAGVSANCIVRACIMGPD